MHQGTTLRVSNHVDSKNAKMRQEKSHIQRFRAAMWLLLFLRKTGELRKIEFAEIQDWVAAVTIWIEGKPYGPPSDYPFVANSVDREIATCF
jgi:hypothetical protein